MLKQSIFILLIINIEFTGSKSVEYEWYMPVMPSPY